MAGDAKGITVLHGGGRTPLVDIIAIHGLCGGSESTWTQVSGDQNIMWLRDFLPKIVPRCRIMTYGYNASAMDGSVGTIRTHAQYFLENIVCERSEKEVDKRPIIFLAHSLGGLVIKEALIGAMSSSNYKAIHTATYGILFFGTPHRGSSKANLAAVLGRVVAAVSHKHHSLLIKALKKDSEILHTISDSFAKQKFQIVSFFEGMPTPPFNDLVVDENSAKIGLHEDFEKSLQLNLSHSELCKFQDEKDVNFKVVSYNIERFVRDAVQKSSGSIGEEYCSNRGTGFLTCQSTTFDGLDPRHEPPAITIMPPSLSRSLQPRPATIMQTISQHSVRPLKPATNNLAQPSKAKGASPRALKAEKAELERQCHKLGQQLKEIGMKRQQRELKRAKLKSQNGGQIQQHVRDKMNMYGNELGRLENDRVGLESKKKKVIGRLEIVERDLSNST